MTTDSFVVRPLRFPGGSIGELAVNGTVNDLAVSGARAQALVVSYVLEAGLPTEILEAEVRAMAAAASAAGVVIAGGDTKVVEHGKADQMYITTSGIGHLIPGLSIRRLRCVAATGSCFPAPSATTASPFSLPAESWISRRTSARTPVPCCRWWRRWRKRRRRRAMDARPHARRGRHDAERVGTIAAWDCALRRRDPRSR